MDNSRYSSRKNSICYVHLNLSIMPDATQPDIRQQGINRAYLFKKSFWRTHIFVWGHWYPCFGFLVTSPLGFKARVGSSLITFFAEVNVMYISQDLPLVLHMLTSWQPAAQPVTPPHSSAGGTWLRLEQAINRTEDERCTIVPAIRFKRTYLSFGLCATLNCLMRSFTISKCPSAQAWCKAVRLL